MNQIGFVTTPAKKELPKVKTPADYPEHTDLSILGEGAVYPARRENDNGNIIVLGTTGSGKTCSIVEPRILHSHHTSLVVPITKRKLVKQYTPLMESRGYEVIDLNLISPKDSKYGYDPMRTAKNEEEIYDLATAIIGGMSKTMEGGSDPFWNDSTSAVCCALMCLTRYKKGKNAGFLDFMELYRNLEFSYPNGHCKSTVDQDFFEMEMDIPDSQAPRQWKILQGCASKTASCIISILNNALSRFCGEYGRELFGKKKMVDLRSIGKKKTLLFVSTRSTSVQCGFIANLLFADLFKELMAEAEENDGHLALPVHVLCDEFSTGSPIPGFSEKIAVFREAGMSCTLLLQSLSQLDYLYGPYASAVIQENCDTLVFLGNNDLRTCKLISERACIPLENVLQMKPGEEILIRRGYEAERIRRYQTFTDPVYLAMIEGLEK